MDLVRGPHSIFNLDFSNLFTLSFQIDSIQLRRVSVKSGKGLGTAMAPDARKPTAQSMCPLEVTKANL
jgi:hypothetical protein